MKRIKFFVLALMPLCLFLFGCSVNSSESGEQVSSSISLESQNSKTEDTAENSDTSIETTEKLESKPNENSEYIFSGVEVPKNSFDGEEVIKKLEEYYSSLVINYTEESYDSQVTPNSQLQDLLVKDNPWSVPYYTDDNYKYNYFTDNRGAYLVPVEYLGSDNVAVIPKYVMGYPVLISDYRKIQAETIISYAGASDPFDSVNVNGECKIFVCFSNSKFTVSSSTVEFVYLPHAASVSILNPALLKDIYAPEASSLQVSLNSSNQGNLRRIYFPNVTYLSGFNLSDSGVEILCLPKWEVKWINYNSSKNPEFKTIICSTTGSIPANSFKDATGVESIYFTNPVKTVGIRAFSGCRALKSVNLERVRSVGDYAFSNCGLESIKFTALAGTSEHSFENMPDLLIAELPNAVTLANYSFKNCPKLKIVIADELEQIGAAALSECPSLEMADYPKVRVMGNNAFANDTSLIYVNFKRLKVIASEAFINCTALKEAHFDSAQRIYNRAFKGDSALSIIEIDGVERIEAYSFQDCTGLTRVRLPYLKNANNNAFEGCNAYIDTDNTND